MMAHSHHIRRGRRILAGLALALLWTAACAPAKTPAAPAGEAPSIALTSPAFAPGESIPPKYTCDGQDLSPPLEWDNVPEGARSFVLIMDDPDAPAGAWVHWVLYDLPAERRSLPEGVPANDELAGGGRHGRNSWRRSGYGGPCPPAGTHRDFFRVYALDARLDLEPGATARAVQEAMGGHVLAWGELMGRYTRQ
mgnify:CR=1 FL=1